VGGRLEPPFCSALLFPTYSRSRSTWALIFRRMTCLETRSSTGKEPTYGCCATCRPLCCRCVVCHVEQFSSTTKYDSGSGWPSFWDVLEQGRIRTRADASAGQRGWTATFVGQVYRYSWRSTEMSSYRLVL
jgi:hypothetical protein